MNTVVGNKNPIDNAKAGYNLCPISERRINKTNGRINLIHTRASRRGRRNMAFTFATKEISRFVSLVRDIPGSSRTSLRPGIIFNKSEVSCNDEEEWSPVG